MQALLIDGLNLARRIYAALPADTKQAPDHIAGVITQTTASVQRALRRHQPSHCLVVFDHSRRNWRHDLLPEYKQNRPPMPPPLQAGLAQLQTALTEQGLRCIQPAGVEADDAIATAAVKIAERGGHALILSTDRNYCQLLSDHIRVFDHFAQRPLDAETIQTRFQIPPQYLPDLFALVGDSGASVPGVKSVGVRTAAKLINRHGDLTQILAATISGKLGKTLRAEQDAALLAKTLFTLKTDVDLNLNLNQLRYNSAT